MGKPRSTAKALPLTGYKEILLKPKSLIRRRATSSATSAMALNRSDPVGHSTWKSSSRRSSRRFFQSQLPDAGNQRAWVDSEQIGGATRTLNPPLRFGDRVHNVGAVAPAPLG